MEGWAEGPGVAPSLLSFTWGHGLTRVVRPSAQEEEKRLGLHAHVTVPAVVTSVHFQPSLTISMIWGHIPKPRGLFSDSSLLSFFAVNIFIYKG